MDTTTGISAPPMGITTKKPNSIETITIVQKIDGDWFITKITINEIIITSIKAFIVCWNLKTIGFPETVPWSFPNASTDPENVIAPIKVPMLISIRLLVPIDPTLPIPNDAGS